MRSTAAGGDAAGVLLERPAHRATLENPERASSSDSERDADAEAEAETETVSPYGAWMVATSTRSSSTVAVPLSTT
jgi:hypothetical protein